MAFLMVTAIPLWGQHVTSSRGLSLGGYTALANELSALDWNPAGLIHVRDWEFSASNALWLSRERASTGLVFQSAGLTKRFMEQHSIAFRYAPSTSILFEIPSSITLGNSQQTFTYDKKIEYHERYAVGYSYRPGENVSLGMSARFLQERIVDTELYVVQDSLTRFRTVDYFADSWKVDVGLLWEPERDWKFGLVAKNLLKVTESQFPQSVQSFALRTVKSLRAGVGYSPHRAWWLGFDFDLDRRGALGMEWNVLEDLSLRQGTTFGGKYGPFVQSIAAGVGWNLGNARVDLGYVGFTSSQDRSTVALRDFLDRGVADIGYNQFTPNQLSLSVSVALGRTRDLLARIEHVQMLDEVYPSSYQVHAYRPLGKAIVRNITNEPIYARVGFYAARFMDKPTETNAVLVPPQSTKEIPFHAVFNEAIMAVSSMLFQAGDVFVRATQASDYDDQVQARLVIRGRNDWDGDVLSLRSFVTPAEPEVLRFTRQVMNEHKEAMAGTPKELEHFHAVQALFNQFAARLVYVGDPRGSKDRVQYPSETLSLRGGDCDDLTVAFATILSSIGVATAFVDVIPPNNPLNAHIYLMFDSGVPASQASLVSTNPKRYVIRRNEQGKETVWVPLETTAIKEGFQQAWEIGAREYYDDVEMNLGLARGWVRVVDVVSVF
jgi:hypothetical protein